MKYIIYILASAIGLSSCDNQLKHVDKIPFPKAVKQGQAADNSKYHTQQDTVFILNETGETLKYAKADFNNIVDKHSEFFEEIPRDPDEVYFSDKNYVGFGSETGQDDYYVLYAYFLKQRNGSREFALQRQKLVDIYSKINALFRYFEYGGTHFGHQSRRISGYAEYSIYLLPKTERDIRKTYDIARQKAQYIQSLRQLINDEIEIDLSISDGEKIMRSRSLNKIVDELNKTITSNFYLRRAQEFQYKHYEYY